MCRGRYCLISGLVAMWFSGQLSCHVAGLIQGLFLKRNITDLHTYMFTFLTPKTYTYPSVSVQSNLWRAYSIVKCGNDRGGHPKNRT